MTSIIQIRDIIYAFGEAAYKQLRPSRTDKQPTPISALANKTLTEQEALSSKKKNKKEDKPFWTTKRKVAALVGLFTTIGAVIALYKNRIDPNTANCIETSWFDESGGFTLQGICCAKNHPGPSEECRATKQQFREEILAENPRATFSYRIQEPDKLSSIAQEIETGLKNLAQMNDTDPGRGDLVNNLANKLFVDLPNYYNSYPIPAGLEALRPKLFAKDLDYMYERNPNLLSEGSLKGLWRKFGLLSHPDKGGDTALFAQGASVYELARNCLRHLSNGNPSCRWMELKPIENFKPEPYENFKTTPLDPSQST